ncbi:MAG: hypothetical protein WAU01_12045, partial [Saprospiraceae bacterium]
MKSYYEPKLLQNQVPPKTDYIFLRTKAMAMVSDKKPCFYLPASQQAGLPASQQAGLSAFVIGPVRLCWRACPPLLKGLS